MKPITATRPVLIDAAERAALAQLEKTTTALLASLWAAFSDDDLIMLAQGLTADKAQRTPAQRDLIATLDRTLKRLETGATRALGGQMDELTDEWKQDIARRYGVRADLVGYTPTADPATTEAERLSAALGVYITPAQAAQLLERTVTI